VVKGKLLVKDFTKLAGKPMSPTLLHRKLSTSAIADIYTKVMEGKRLSFDDGVRLWKHPSLTDVGAISTSTTRTSATRAASSAHFMHKRAVLIPTE
jgi:hypothetical protein